MTAGTITPELGEVLEYVASSRAARMHIALPGTVLAYDPDRNLVDVELEVRDAHENDEDELVVDDYPTLIGVPLVFPRAKNAFFAWAVEKGDRVAVMFASQAIDQWLGTGKKSAPGDLRRHDLAHAFAVPGLYPMIEPIAAGDRQAGGAAMGIPGGLQIRFTSTEIKLGKNATDPVALTSKVMSVFGVIANAASGDAIAGAVQGALTGLGLSGVGSTKVKSE